MIKEKPPEIQNPNKPVYILFSKLKFEKALAKRETY